MTLTAEGSATDVALAMDVGGTAIKVGLVPRDGTARSIRRLATPQPATPSAVGRVLAVAAAELAGELRPEERIMGTGVSIAAFITPEGVVTATASQLESDVWVGADLGGLWATLPEPRAFALDSPAPGLGEAHFGAGRGAHTLAYVTVSTGIGAAVIQQGRHWGGGVGWAGGLGHSIIDEHSERVCPGCGNHGCLETFAARHGLLASARAQIAVAPDGALAQRASAAPEGLSPRLIAAAALAGDEAARQILASAGHALGIGLTNLIDIMAPDRVVVGGGIALAGDLLLGPARAVVRERAFPPVLKGVPVLAAELGDLSGLYGAAALVLLGLRVEPTLETLR